MWQHICAGLTHPLPILHDLGRFPCFHSSQATRTLFLLKARQVPSLHFSKPYNDTPSHLEKNQVAIHHPPPLLPIGFQFHWPPGCSPNTAGTLLPPYHGSIFLHQKYPPAPNILEHRSLTSYSFNFHFIQVPSLARPT